MTTNPDERAVALEALKTLQGAAYGMGKPSKYKIFQCAEIIHEALTEAPAQPAKPEGDMVENAQAALDKIEDWSKAYPESIFPKPNFDKVRLALEVNGLTLDAVSADNMRHVITKVHEILQPVRDLLKTDGRG